jgi:hypothetical protein
MIYAFVSGKREQDRYIKACAAAVGAKIVHTKHFISLQPGHSNVPPRLFKKRFLPGVTGIIFAGVLRGNAHLFNMVKEQGLDFYYIDHAYFQRGYTRPYWMRITKNGFVQNSILPNADQSRYVKHFNYEFKDYNFKDKKNILVLPPSNVLSKVFNKAEWEINTVNELRRYTDRPIVIRRKQGSSIDDLLMNVIESKNVDVYEKSLEEEFEDAYCVVSFNSAATLDALRLGIPVICDKFCPAFPLTHSFDQIENLQEKERLPLFSSLAHGQHTFEEASNIKTFRYLDSVRQWRGNIYEV